jgi:hypothetical protein
MILSPKMTKGGSLTLVGMLAAFGLIGFSGMRLAEMIHQSASDSGRR